MDGPKIYWLGPGCKWNWLDSASIAATLCWLGYNSWDHGKHTQAFEGVAILLGWMKMLYFLRGFETTAFVVNMLSEIAVDMLPFLIVLLVIMAA